MRKDSVKIGWIRDNGGFYASAVHSETLDPLGSISIIPSDRGYDLTAYAFGGGVKSDWMDKNQGVSKMKGLCKCMMYALLDVDLVN